VIAAMMPTISQGFLKSLSMDIPFMCLCLGPLRPRSVRREV
jgi:hypothetical protein